MNSYQLKIYKSEDNYEIIDIENFSNALRRHVGQGAENELEYSLIIELAPNDIDAYAYLFESNYEKLGILVTSEEVITENVGTALEKNIVKPITNELIFTGYSITRIQRGVKNTNGKEFLQIEFEK